MSVELIRKSALPGIALLALVAVMAFNFRKLRRAPGVGAVLYVALMILFVGMVIWQGNVLGAGIDIDANGPHARTFLIMFVTEMVFAIGLIMYVAFTSD